MSEGVVVLVARQTDLVVPAVPFGMMDKMAN